jgi:hypothetical protein
MAAAICAVASIVGAGFLLLAPARRLARGKATRTPRYAVFDEGIAL